MRSKYILVVLSVVGAMAAVAVVVLAGDPDNPPGPPETTYSYTLEDIYNRLDTGAAGTPITFTEPISGPTVGTMHTLDDIYDLIGERAFVPKTGQITSYATGDDGDLETGVDWVTSTRFVTGTTGVVTDTLTGLIWLENANCAGDPVTWTLAISYSNALYDGCTDCFGTSGDCGLSDGSSAGDWRLPNIRELQSLIDYGEYAPALPGGHPFTGVQFSPPSDNYCSSTTLVPITYNVWYVDLFHGFAHPTDKSNTFYVWPVRGGQ